MKTKKNLVFLLMLVLMVTLFSACDNISDIQLNVKTGDKYNVTQSTEQKISMDANGQKIDVTQIITTGYTYNITDVTKDDLATISVTYDTLSVKQTSVDGTKEYDSKKSNSKADPQNIIYNSMIGHGFTFKVSKDGKIKSIDGVNKMLDNILTKLDGFDAITKAELVNYLKQNFGDDAIKESLSQMTEVYPDKDKKIKMGSSWKSEETIAYGFPMKLNNVCKLKELKNGVYTVNINSKISANDDGKELDLAGLKMKYKISGNENGTIKLNKDNPFIQNGELSQSLKGTAEVNVSEQNLSIPVTIESKISYTVKKQ